MMIRLVYAHKDVSIMRRKQTNKQKTHRKHVFQFGIRIFFSKDSTGHVIYGVDLYAAAEK